MMELADILVLETSVLSGVQVQILLRVPFGRIGERSSPQAFNLGIAGSNPAPSTDLYDNG